MFLVIFVLLQSMLPLLHVHVTPTAHAESGIHFHAAPLPATLPGDGEHLADSTVGESQAITAPNEHRRDESVFDARLSGGAPGFEPAAPQSLLAQTVVSASALAADTVSHTRPPTRAPPSFS